MQNEIVRPEELFNGQGVLANPGWARKMHFRYDPAKMAAPSEKLREWDYYFIGSEALGMSITIKNTGGTGALVAKLLNFREGYDLAKTLTLPENILQPRDDTGTCHIRAGDAEGMFIRKPGKTYIKLHMPDYHEGHAFDADITLDVPDTDRMVIATPFTEGEQYFFFNEKRNCMAVSGTLTLGNLHHTFDPERDFAVLDFGRGVWPDKNRWYWGSASGKLQGKLFGFNIGYGFGDLSHATENMIFYDGRAHKFGDMTFDIPPEGHMAGDWHLYSSDGRFDMRMAPVYDRYVPCDIEKGPSLQHQVFGRFTGKAVLDDGTVLQVKDFFGFAEDIINNWTDRRATMQNEIKSPQPLFNERGVLANPGWARRMHFRYDPTKMAAPRNKCREWDYYFVGSEKLGISMTINNFGGLGMLTAKLMRYDGGYHLKKTTVVLENIHQPRDDEGTCYIKAQGAEGMYIRKPGKHYIKLNMPDFHEGNTYQLDITLDVPDTDRMVIATPFQEGEHMFFFNEKLNCMRASGTVKLGDFVHTFDPGRDFGVLDFGRGVWPDRNRWYWGSASGQLDGHLFGFNLGYGFGDLSHATENMIFYDGVAHKFGGITFDIPQEGHMAADWHIYSDDGRFDMMMHPILDRDALCDIEKGGSLQHQVFGRYTGKCVLDDGTVLQVNNFFGFAEDVINNWNLTL